MRRYALLVLAALVLLAGCGGSPGSGSTAVPSTTTAPETTTTTTTTTATPADDPVGDDFAPGVSGAGIKNVTALLASHRRTLLSEGFAVTLNVTRSGGSVSLSARYAPEDTRMHLTRNASTERASVGRSFWLDGGVEILRSVQDNETRYRYAGVGAPEHRVADATEMTALDRFIAGGNYSTVRANDTEAVFVATEFDDATRDGVVAERVRLAVSPGGYVRSMNLTGHASGNAEASVAVRYSVETVGVGTVGRPAWVGTAPEPFDGRPVVEFENCTRPYATLTVTGNDTLAAGTELALAVDGRFRTVTLSEALAPDGVRYVYRARDGAVAIDDELPRFDDRGALPTRTQVRVVTDDRLLVLQGGFGFSCASASAGDG